jgi:hypothetical protein
MKYLMVLAAGVCLILSTAVLAQETPKPGPEHKKLGQLEGNFTCEGTSFSEKATGTGTCEWGAGGFFMVCKQQFAPASGTVDIHTIYGYNPHEKAYTMYRYWSNGHSDFSKGWVKDNTWTFVFEDERANDKLQRRQMTMEIAGDSSTYKWEHSVEGEPWHVTTEGKCTKVTDTTN